MSKKSKVHPNYKTRYKVRNWGSYDHALVQRGDLTLWLSPTAVASWTALPSLKPGGQRYYSDVAIEAALMLRLQLRSRHRWMGGVAWPVAWSDVGE